MFTLNNHGLRLNDIVILTTSGALPTGLSSGVFYWVTSTSLTTNTFTLPTSGTYNVSVGENYFMYVFLDDVSGFTNINLYDFQFNLVNSAATEFTSFWSLESCNDNFVVIINKNGKYYNYLVTENEITYNEVTDNNSYYTFNDYVWWD